MIERPKTAGSHAVWSKLHMNHVTPAHHNVVLVVYVYCKGDQLIFIYPFIYPFVFSWHNPIKAIFSVIAGFTFFLTNTLTEDGVSPGLICNICLF